MPEQIQPPGEPERPYRTSPLPDDLGELVEKATEEELDGFLRVLHPADLADLLREVEPDRHWSRVLAHLPDQRLSAVLLETEGGVHDDLMERLPTERLARLVGFMESDDAADVLGDLRPEVRDRVVGALRRRDADALARLLAYPEDTAGGIMQTELAKVRTSATLDDAVAAIRQRARQLGPSLNTIYVVDEGQRLVGEVPLHTLVLADQDQPVEAVMEPARHRVTPEVDQEEVAQLFKRYDLVSLPVVDEAGRLLGRILIDDVLDVLEEEVDEDVMRMVGADEEDLVYSDRILRISAYRLPWLVVNLLGGLFTGWLAWKFRPTFELVLALVAFMPVITAMGGNVGTQSTTILIRGFATGRVSGDNLGAVFLKELLIGLTMGLVCGLLVAGAAILWHGDPFLGLVVAIAMVSGMTVAAMLGSLAPAAFRRLKIDPAIAAGPFVTTANDILGILIYFGTATLFLDLLVH